jgi:hypothetical protein
VATVVKLCEIGVAADATFAQPATTPVDCISLVAPATIADGGFNIQLTDDAANPFNLPIPTMYTGCSELLVDVGATNYDDFEFVFNASNSLMMVERIGIHCYGTCSTLATFTFADRGGVSLGAAITSTTGTGVTALTNLSSNNRALASGEGLVASVSNTPVPTTDEYRICYAWDSTAANN